MSENVEKVRRALVGRVVSDKMQKTVTVLVERRVKHPQYGKIITRSAMFKARVVDGVVAQCDLVEIEECRPISRTKTWRVAKVLEKATII